jgi:hypothetical protein
MHYMLQYILYQIDLFIVLQRHRLMHLSHVIIRTL